MGTTGELPYKEFVQYSANVPVVIVPNFSAGTTLLTFTHSFKSKMVMMMNLTPQHRSATVSRVGEDKCKPIASRMEGRGGGGPPHSQEGRPKRDSQEIS